MIAEVATRADVGTVFFFLLFAGGVWTAFLTYCIQCATDEILKAIEKRKDGR